MSESGTNTPSMRSSDAGLEHDGSDTSTRRPTRTVAIIKTHALDRRIDIERRIEEANFEIIKERQMEFNTESDHDYLQELFGEDTPSLFEGPVWIYVLARRRADSVLCALMGPNDPDVAREQAPNSLRALYGLSTEQNAVGAARDEVIAEEMIACLFASSPPFEPTEGLDGVLDELHLGVEGDEFANYSHVENGLGERTQAYLSPTSSQTRSSTNSDARPQIKARTNSGTVPIGGSNPHFRARALPKSTHAPDSQPRTTRAAALRSGALVVRPVPFGARKETRKAPTREEQRQAFLDVPGHKRSTSIAVASTAPPTVAPRMTRAASLRIAGGSPTTPKIRPSFARAESGRSNENVKKVETNDSDAKNIFDGVPGHKRRESFSVASVRTPTVAPRLNKSAELRARKDAPPPPTSFRTASTSKVPASFSRATSQSLLNSGQARPARPRSSLATPNPTHASNGTLSRSSSSLALSSPPPRPPSIEPRSNRSAVLRAAKKLEAAGGKVVAKVKPSHPPVSMKNITNGRAVAT